MGFAPRISIEYGKPAPCPHCNTDLGDLAGDYSCGFATANDTSIDTDSEGYCRNWNSILHANEFCPHCDKHITFGIGERDVIYVIACRSQADVRYLELRGVE
ncbi:MAG: hypothetical protein QM488_12780 [Rhizobiaceae bacterium]